MNDKKKSSVKYPTIEEIPKEFKIEKPIFQDEYLCGGIIKKWTGARQEVYSPVCINENGKIKRFHLGSYPQLTAKESLEALKSSEEAWNHGRGEWPTMTVEERIKAVSLFVQKMKEKREEIVRILMWEIGKTLKDSRKEFDRTIIYIQDTIDALKNLDRISSRFDISEGVIGQIRRAPLGIVLCMGPFNYPLNETFTTLIPALIMGNVVIFKPPKLGVLLHRPLLEIYRDCFPPGVVNTVYGDGATVIGPLMESGKINVLAFIGSCKVSNILKKQHPYPNRLRSVLGLGAKNPAIILPDADIELAVKEGVLGALSYNGQRCTALKVFFVHKSICDKFITMFSEAVSSLKIGMPWEEGVDITPLAEDNKCRYMTEYIKDAEEKGARVVNESGGEYFETVFNPAVLFPVKPGMRIYEEEQFGPIIPILEYSDISEPIDYIVSSEFGQQVSIFGKDPEQIAKLIDMLANQICRININSQCQRGPDTFPFTGRKDSAEGTLSVSDALRVFTIRTLVGAKEHDLNKEIINDIVKNHKSKFLSTDFIF